MRLDGAVTLEGRFGECSFSKKINLLTKLIILKRFHLNYASGIRSGSFLAWGMGEHDQKEQKQGV